MAKISGSPYGITVLAQSYYDFNPGKSPVKPDARISMASAAVINPPTRVATFIPVMPSATDTRCAARNVIHVISATAAITIDPAKRSMNKAQAA